MFVRRAATLAAATTAALALSTGAASAHFCYFSDPNEKANAGRAGSSGFISFSNIAAQFLPDLCSAGVAYAANAAGVTPDTLINAHGVMAGPTGGNKKISHLDFAGLDAALGTEEDPGPAWDECAE